VTVSDQRSSDKYKIAKKGGGYESGPKKVSELKPPPRGPGVGAKPSNNSDKK
jgi:hypothetical protein